MNPLFGNACNLQMELLNHWYRNCNTSLKTLGTLFDMSGDIMRQAGRIPGIDTGSTQKDATRNRAKTRPVTTGLAVVTGGIGGIGTAICKRLSTAGNLVIATYIAAEADKAAEWKQAMESEGYAVEIYQCDVADFDDCTKFANTVREQHGELDVLVNAAGITRDAMLRKMDPANWHAVLNTNLDSVYNVTRQFIDGMLRRQYGRIINISSVNGQKGQFGQTNYSTSKAGMIGFTRSLALEYANKGITVNCICPGYVHTAMVDAIKKEVLDGIIAQIPAGRLATPAEIAEAVAFLADRNSAYITGTELAVNGGLWLG